MNLVKAADDIKNLSDQQLISAGQNPVMIPPYLVLAEMKRREQLRAEFAKAQQQPQPSVAQQVAQNLVQPQPGQSQQGMQQAPPQGIMQAAPPQAQAMAGGGIVGRYADGGKQSLADQFLSRSSGLIDSLKGLAPSTAAASVPIDLATDPAQIRSQFAQKPVSDYLSQLEGLQGKADYSAAEQVLRQQLQQAQARKPRIGDALIAAGAAMAANRDNRVGLANLLAQAIGTGSQTYETAKREQEKELNAAMLAKASLDKMKQEDFQKRVSTALQMAQGDQTKLIEAYKIGESNKKFYITQFQNAKTQEDKRRFDLEVKRIDFNLEALKAASSLTASQQQMASREKIAGMEVSAANARAFRPRDVPEFTRANDLTKTLESRLGQLQKTKETSFTASPEERAALDREIAETTKQYRNALSFATQSAAGAGIRSVDMSGFTPPATR